MLVIRSIPVRTLALLLLAAAIALPARAQSSTPQIVAAANDFLATLTPDQRAKVLYAFSDQTQRARWSNFPTGFVPRGGISLRQMTPIQQAAVMKLLATVLSPMGVEKVNQIRQADDDFKANGSKRPRNGPGGPNGPSGPGGPPPGSTPGPNGPPPGGPNSQNRRPPQLSGDLFGADLYFISFLGTPSLTQPWMLQFGCHHLALNITVAGARGVLTPSLTGAQPALFTLNGKTIRPLGRESDKALTLLHSLDDTQRKQAVLPYTVADLVLGPGQDGKKIAPEGLRASAMTASQRAMLLDLIAEWSGILNQASAAPRMAQLRADLDQTWFAWSWPSDNPHGATTGEPGTNITAYYRIQGPHLVLEYAPQRDEPGNHVHTIYRDPTDDYGAALTHP